MVAEFFSEQGFLSYVVCFGIAGYFTLWLWQSYPIVSLFATVAGVALVIHNTWIGEPSGWLDYPFFVMVMHMIFSLFFTREGWKLIAAFIAAGIVLSFLDKMKGE